MKQVNIVLFSAISFMLYSSYGIAGGTSDYDYTCPLNQTTGKTQECCININNNCYSGEAEFNSGTTGITSGQGKHKLKPGHSKKMTLKCSCKTPMDPTCTDSCVIVHSWGYWAQGKIVCTSQDAMDTAQTITINCSNLGTEEKKFGLEHMTCKFCHTG